MNYSQVIKKRRKRKHLPKEEHQYVTEKSAQRQSSIMHYKSHITILTYILWHLYEKQTRKNEAQKSQPNEWKKLRGVRRRGGVERPQRKAINS